VQPLEVAGAHEEALDRLEDRPGLRQAADPGQARRELADLRLHDAVAEVAQRGDVALGRGVGPHPGVHGRGDDDRRPAGAGDGGDRVADQPGGELTDEVRRRRGEDDRIGRLRQLDVSDLLVGVELEHVVEDGAVGERLERQWADEAGGGGGHGHVDDRPALGQQPDQADRLVGRDAARHADDDPPPGERPEALGHAGCDRVVARWRSRICCHA
jgi:hypothetical protein